MSIFVMWIDSRVIFEMVFGPVYTLIRSLGSITKTRTQIIHWGCNVKLRSAVICPFARTATINVLLSYIQTIMCAFTEGRLQDHTRQFQECLYILSTHAPEGEL